MQLIQNGGKVVAAGGYGCIFNPALKCGNHTIHKRDPNKITKLMTEKNATEEYEKIETFKNILKVVPNYTKYFLLNNFELCKPNKLTERDLVNYSKKCKPLKKKGITRKNINENLDKVMAINMPDGGIDVEKYINKTYFKGDFDKHDFVLFNNSLIDLLINGIVPMNKLHVYHFDIKDSNILVKKNQHHINTRLIDWGLSIKYDNIHEIPKNIYKRPFQYNIPFSSIIFNNDFKKRYDEFLYVNPNPHYYQIREFVVNFIFVWDDIRGSGHLSTIHDIITQFTSKKLPNIKRKKVKKHIIEYGFTYYYIVEYISTILHHYTKDGAIDIMSYFNNVFIKNVDIWGFVISYISFYENLYADYKYLTYHELLFIKQIKFIIMHFLYQNPIHVINIHHLVVELTKLNEIVQHFIVDKTSTSNSEANTDTKSNKNNSIDGGASKKHNLTYKNNKLTNKNGINLKNHTRKRR